MHVEHREPGRHDRGPQEQLPEPNVDKLAESLRSTSGRSVALTGLFVLAAFYTLY